MKEFRALWKTLAQDKKITCESTFQYCILRAMAAKDPDKRNLAKNILQSAFTPITNINKLTKCKYPAYRALELACAASFITSHKDRPGILLSVLETPEEIEV